MNKTVQIKLLESPNTTNLHFNILKVHLHICIEKRRK